MSGIVILFLLLDGAMKLCLWTWPSRHPSRSAFRRAWRARSGCPGAHAALRLPAHGGAGAILLTGYLGGAVATHLRVGDPLFTHVLFGVYLGLMAWGGLYLRDSRLRALIPLQRD